MAGTTWQQHWPLFVAAIPLLAAAVALLRRFVAGSAGGQLDAALKDHKRATRQLKTAHKRLARAVRKHEQLDGAREKTRPSVLAGAVAAREDATALVKIAADRAMVTANHVRRVIHEEFPPDRQDSLRARYLPDDSSDGKPFSFGG